MTCREKLALDHPDWASSYLKAVLNLTCPSTHGYLPEPTVDGSQVLSCPTYGCDKCWGRNIPGTVDVNEFRKLEFFNPASTNVDQRLADFESIGMEPDELKKAAELYRRVKEVME